MNAEAALEGIARDRNFRMPRSAVIVLLLLLTSATASFGQKVSEPANSTVTLSVRATHLLGFEGAGNNSTGTLSIQDGVVRFQKGSERVVQVPIASVQDVFLGDESKQVGGPPMTVGKAAVPFGGGRVVSLFAHKKYDTITLQYVANDGGIHGAIFELSMGQGKRFRDQLAAMGADVSRNNEVKQSNVAIPNESK